VGDTLITRRAAILELCLDDNAPRRLVGLFTEI
jgi:hypothetical protein